MKIRVIPIVVLLCVTLGSFLFHCQIPEPPPGADEAKVKIFFRSPTAKISDLTLTDTVGNRDTICVVLYLTQFIDSASVKVFNGTVLEYDFSPTQKKVRVDTLYYGLPFNTSGDRTVKAVGYISGQPNSEIIATIHIVDKSSNLKNTIVVPKSKQAVMPGNICTFSVSATGPDSDKVVIETSNKPATATFSNKIFSWTPATADIGSHTVVFTAKANGTLVATDSVTIQVSATAVDQTVPVIHLIAPELDSSTVSSSSYQFTVSCKDESGIDSVRFFMGSDKFDVTKSADSLYSAIVTGLQISQWNTIRVYAWDASPAANKCSLYVHTKYDPAIIDNVAPIITLVSPSKDTVVNVDSCVVKVKCTDQSGVAKVTMNIGTDTVTAKRGAENIFTATVKKLAAGQSSIITVTATDSAATPVTGRKTVQIKCDNDNINPVLTRLSPLDSVVSTNSTSYTISVTCSDASGVLSVNAMLGSQSFTGTRGTDNNWTVTVSGLVSGSANAVVVTAVDSSMRANKSTLNYKITSDPTMLDTLGPTITPVSGPSSGSTVITSSVDIVVGVSDPSEIDSVYYTKNSSAKKMMTQVSGSAGQYSLQETMDEGNVDTLTIIAVDKATHHNRSKLVVTLNYFVPPQIATQPESKEVCQGTAASFSVTATGTATLKYQWRNGGSNISGATSASYSPGTSTPGQTILTCVVSNNSGKDAVSNPCTLTVNSFPSIASSGQPQSVSVCQGNDANLQVNATGASGYQWYSGAVGSGTALTGATSSTYSTSTAGTYYCVVSNNSNCTLTSTAATVTVNNPPAITAQPQNASACSGSNATLQLTATGASGYQWYSGAAGSGSPISGATSASFSTPNAGSYYCVVKNSSNCTVTSTVATVTINNPPSISSNPQSVTICSGTSASLQVAAIGASSYQWYKGAVGSGTVVNGATSSTYSASATGSYYCVVKNSSNCSVNSTAATVTVSNPPSVSISGASPACVGSNVTLSVQTGSGWSYLWSRGSTQLSTQATLRLNNIQTAQGGTYTCVVTDANGCSSTATANLTVNPFIVSPAWGGQTNVCITDAATVTAPCGVTFEWWFDPWGSGNYSRVPDNSGDLVGQGTPTLRSNTPAGSYVYCIVTNIAGVSTTSGTFFFGSMFCP